MARIARKADSALSDSGKPHARCRHHNQEDIIKWSGMQVLHLHSQLFGEDIIPKAAIHLGSAELERMVGLEPTAPSLACWCSPPELHPQYLFAGPLWL